MSWQEEQPTSSARSSSDDSLLQTGEKKNGLKSLMGEGEDEMDQ